VIQVLRFIRGESIDSGAIALLWLIVFGLYLVAVPWSADARQAAKATRVSTPTLMDPSRE
jgi:hypothetical protein